MLKFFRKIRQELLSDNQFSKYLLYAIGEILLVVIGILIALQINNWNEAKKDKAAELIALIDLKEEFETNHTNFIELLTYKKERTQAWKEYLTIVSDPKRSIAERGRQRPVVGSKSYEFSNSTLNSILSSGKIDKIGNDTLKSLLSNWTDKINIFNRVASLHLDFFQILYPKGIVKATPFDYQKVVASENYKGVLSYWRGFRYYANEIRNNAIQEGERLLVLINKEL